MNSSLSVMMVVRNEEKKIRRCLESVRWADEIVVVDQSSTDSTVSICRKYTDNVSIVPAHVFCEPDRTTACNKATHDWILYIDADEEITEELKARIRSLLSPGSSAYGAYYIRRKNIFLGKWIRGSGWDPGYVMRLFKKGAVTFPEKIHAGITPLVKSGRIEEPIIHYTCETLEEYISKMNRYTGVLAREAYEQGERVTLWNAPVKIVLLPALYFFYKYIVKAGFRDGFQGFIIGFFTYLTIMLKHLKLMELQYAKIGKR